MCALSFGDSDHYSPRALKLPLSLPLGPFVGWSALALAAHFTNALYSSSLIVMLGVRGHSVLIILEMKKIWTV